jgi:nuclear pore complex protein Nup188
LPGDDDNTTVANLSESNVLMQSMTGPSTPPSSRKTFSKSLSMTSTTSVVSTTQIQPSNDLLTRLDCKLSISALEFILSLLASQSLLALKGVSLSDRDEQFKQLLRRELKTELSTFHDLVKKRIMRDGKCNWSRRKYGISLMKNLRIVDDDDDDEDEEPVRQSVAVRSSTASKSLRAQVTRKNWQQQLQTPAPAAPVFNMSKVYSPIGESTPLVSTSSAMATPPKGILKPHSSTALKRHVAFEDDTMQKKTCNEDEPIFFEPDDPVFTGLSFVKIVEEDYFHFLSNLFGTICHTEN